VFRKIADHPHIPFERYADDAICHFCSLTGGFYTDVAEQWEPDEVRASRPVDPRGAI
jgi:hypothetical protein